MASSVVERRFQPLGNTFLNIPETLDSLLEISTAYRNARRRSLSCHGVFASKDSLPLPQTFAAKELSPAAALQPISSQVLCLAAEDQAHSITAQVEMAPACPQPPDSEVEVTLAYPQPPKSNEKAFQTEKQVEAREVTTMMIRNLPKVSQTDLLHELNKSGFKDTYNFAYMPCTFVGGKGKGYAFVNFCSAELASRMQKSWNRATRFGKITLAQPLSVAAAAIQGLEANLTKWTRPRMNRIRNPNLRPFFVVRCDNEVNEDPCPLADCEPCEELGAHSCTDEELGAYSCTDEEPTNYGSTIHFQPLPTLLTSPWNSRQCGSGVAWQDHIGHPVGILDGRPHGLKLM